MHFIFIYLHVLFLSFFSAVTASDGAMLEIGNRKQLFIDDYMIQSLRDAKQVLNTAVKEPSNPIIKPDQAWEGSLTPIAKVLYDKQEQLFKMWYTTSADWRAQRGGKFTTYDWTDKGANWKRVSAPYRYAGTMNTSYGRGQRPTRLCYATSRDGVHWEKPNLGKVEFNGSKSNNILPEGSRPPTFEDIHETDPKKRYKSIQQLYRRDDDKSIIGMQLHLYYSANGFDWNPDPDNPVMDTTPEPGRWGPSHHMGWDPIREVYAIHIENCLHRKCPTGKRIVGRAESPDMKTWSLPQNILLPDDRDSPDTEFYNFPVIAYEGTYIATPWIFRTTLTLHYPTLAFSRDGVHFERRFREPLVRPGDEGSFDSVSVYSMTPIMQGGKILIYYTGANWRGPEQLFLKEKAEDDFPLRAPGLATLPEDGFVSIDAGKLRPGVLLTQTFSFEGRSLNINMEAARHNDGAGIPEIKVEILDHQTKPVPGFSLEQSDSMAVRGSIQASWQGRVDVGSLIGKPIQLRFSIRNARLFSFQFK